jgi:hypothetical protein
MELLAYWMVVVAVVIVTKFISTGPLPTKTKTNKFMITFLMEYVYVEHYGS